ncbi:MAG TPA: VWA domain-containing protein [Pyrinomonadaceae bacterium]
MRFKLPLVWSLSTIVALTLLAFNSSAQSPKKKRPKLKDFGSSLKRMRWDPITKTSIQSRSPAEHIKNSGEDDVIRIETNLVTCDILVVDRKGNIVQGLAANDLSVTEDGEPQQVVHFLRGDNASIPRTIVLIIDYSGSQLPYLRNSIDAAKLMVDKLAPLDLMAIVTDDVDLLIDFTNDKDKLKKKLESLIERTKNDDGSPGFGPGQRLGKSVQYSALMATLNEAFLEEDLRPIIVFQTDGDEIYKLREPILTPTIPPDLPEELRAQAEINVQTRIQHMRENMVEFSLADIYRAADKSRATIYTVIPGVKLIGRSPEEQIMAKKNSEASFMNLVDRSAENALEAIKESQTQWRFNSPRNVAARTREAVTMQTALAALAPRTGGWTEILETPEQAEGIYSRIFSDINQRYIVGYYPTNKRHDGKQRKIKFEIKGHPEYYILGRNSYYAPSSQ